MESLRSIFDNIVLEKGVNGAIILENLLTEAATYFEFDYDSVIQRLVPFALGDIPDHKKNDIAINSLSTMRSCLKKEADDIANVLHLTPIQFNIFEAILHMEKFSQKLVCINLELADEWEKDNLLVEAEPPFTEGRYICEPVFLEVELALYEPNVVKHELLNGKADLPEDTLSFVDYLHDESAEWASLSAEEREAKILVYLSEETNQKFTLEPSDGTVYKLWYEVIHEEKEWQIDTNSDANQIGETIEEFLQAA